MGVQLLYLVNYLLEMNGTYSFLLALLFDHVGQDFGSGLTLSVQQISRHSSLRNIFCRFLLSLALLMHLDSVKDRRVNGELSNSVHFKLICIFCRLHTKKIPNEYSGIKFSHCHQDLR